MPFHWMMAIALAGPHADQMAQFGAPEARAARTPAAHRPAAMPVATPGPDMTVYGYLAYWSDDLASLPWDELSHLAIFAAEAETDGTLTQTSRWDIAAEAVAMAAPYGVQVHLCVINFDREELGVLLGSPSARSSLVAELASWQAATGAHGINVDFEGVPGDRREEMVDFVQELQLAVGDVVLATPAVDWSDAWDYAALTDHADLFIMGYGYHWNGSSYAGPTDPLYAGSGTVWSGINSFSLSWSVDDYVSSGADPDRVILGLPLYGIRWPTASDAVPSATLGSGSSIVFADAWAEGAVHGVAYEPDSQSLHTYDGSEQIWYGDADTLQDRVVYARDVARVGGIGFWAMHYDDDDRLVWDMIRDETTWTSPTDTTDTGPGTTDTRPGTTDTGPGTTGRTDTGPTGATPDEEGGTDVPSQSLPPPPPEKGGCGCSGAPSWRAPTCLLGRRR